MLLLLAVLCGLAACGKTDTEAGRYLCVQMWRDGVALEAEDCSLLLDQGGYGRLNLHGMDGAIRWRRSDTALQVDVNGELLSGSIADGLVRLSTTDGLELLFAREELAEEVRSALQAEEEENALRASVWLGDWYGWWRIENAQGELENTWYDLCARIRAQADGRLYLLLWDEDQTAQSPMGELLLRLDEEGSTHASEGYFWLDPLSGEDWSLAVENGFLTAVGHHSAGEESFDYTLCLRRWGESWSDESEKPYYYEQWYLPLVEAGETMPDAMEIEK